VRALSRLPRCAGLVLAGVLCAPVQAAPSIGTPEALRVYVSDCQPGAAAGCVPGDDTRSGFSEAAPRRTLRGLNFNELPAGSQVLLVRGGAWRLDDTLIVDNPLATTHRPLVIGAYGSGERPWLQAPGLAGAAIAFGKYGNTSNDGGYVLRDLKLDGRGSAMWGVFVVHNLHDLVIENTEITGFHIGIHAQAKPPHGLTHVAIRHNRIAGNRGMGILGQFSSSVIEDNLFEANNVSGSPYNHAIYLSGQAGSGRDNVVRRNTLRRNSVVDGVCRGGNLTVHGQVEGLVIEDNLIELPAAVRSCRGISITSGYRTPEWFHRVVVRRNTLVNLGGCGVCVNSAPGIVVEGNRFVQRQPTPHVAVAIRDDGGFGDVSDRDAEVRDNIVCFPHPARGQVVADVASPGAVVQGNQVFRGQAGAAGACAGPP
jgi:hypothetical protein